MWQLKHIPQHIHFYWGGKKLSYLRYLSIQTFQRLNPNWKISLHVPQVLSQAQPAWDTMQQKNSCIGQDYLDQLTDVDVVVHDFANYGFDNQAHEVHKSDFLRWRLLATEGGVWSDIDILYCRPMSDLRDNLELNADIDTVLCPLKPPYKHTVGFLMSSVDNKFCEWMHNTSRDCYDPNVYQCMGSDILNENFPTLNSFQQQFDHKFMFLDKNSVYAVTSKEIHKFYQPVDADTKKKIAKSSVIGFHWFAGHPASQQFENVFDKSNTHRFDNLLTHALKELDET